jgi:DNA-binding CsgD family transcriptional regulator
LEQAYRRLAEATDLIAAAHILKEMGEIIGMPYPAVVDDYSKNRLLPAGDGRALASVFGWEPEFQDQWVDNKLYLVSPIAAVCRMTTKPFAWDAAVTTQAVAATQTRPAASWHLTPERGIVGGITVPIHLPRCRTGSVAWCTRDPDVDIEKVLERYFDLLRLAAFRFMDLVYAIRDDDGGADQKPAQLSERELECLTWVALGRTDTEIAAILHRSPTTARFHVDNAIEKLGARNRAQAVAIASQLGLIHAID